MLQNDPANPTVRRTLIASCRRNDEPHPSAGERNGDRSVEDLERSRGYKGFYGFLQGETAMAVGPPQTGPQPVHSIQKDILRGVQFEGGKTCL